jgi:murein DD-endopeptidase MepM/ murein hydrolase activator NlpD
MPAAMSRFPGLLIVAIASALLPVRTEARRPGSGWGFEDSGFSDALSAPQRAAIESDIAANRMRLQHAGMLPRDSAAAAVIGGLRWPLQATPAFVGFSYHGVSNFVDHDPRAPGFVKDYTCGTRTYDSPNGSNHAGTDYFITPFSWLMMDQQQIAIVAAAAGTIVGKTDGNFDRDCAIDFAKDWNAVYVEHADGSVAWYGHMKKGSVTSKAIGAQVDVGEVLGYVGSSGASSGPHLHFELHDSGGAIVDPRHGQCNAAPDLWAVFQAYEDPAINSLSTHSAEPDFVDCGVGTDGSAVTDVPNYADAFDVGDTVHVVASYRDQRNGEATHFEIRSPDASVVDTWDFDLAESQLPKPFYAGTAFSWIFALPATAAAGTWHVTATFQGRSYDHAFTVANPWRRDAGAVADARAQAGSAATRCRATPGAPSPCKP